MNFFGRFNWLVTIFSFLIILFLALFIWWQNLVFSSSKLSPEMLSVENDQDFEEKDQQIKKIMEALEERQKRVDNFPSDSLPREKVFKSEFVWEEETASEDEANIEKTEENSSAEKISL